MPSPEQNRDRKVRRKINPATASVEELVSHLATDPASGLSPKEAERRLQASAAKPLYRLPSRRFLDCIKQTVKEPALWLLLSVALISLFFDRVALGLVCLALGTGNTLLSAFFLYRAAAINTAFAAYDAPLCRVLRGRRIHRIGAAELVRGDIVLFYPGDMIPADCRLLRTDGFAVSEREIDAHDANRPLIRLEKDASAVPDTVGNYRLSPVNMVFAGGICEAGFAIATVIAVGSESHLGGLTGGLPSPHGENRPALHQKASRILSIYNLALLLLVLPVTAVGIFTLGDRYDLLDIFLAGLALASVALTEQILAKSTYIYAILRRKAATERDAANSADVRSASDPERLVEVTDLILVGTSALHDGECHAESLLVGKNTYRCDRPEADDSTGVVAELFYLYRHGLLSYPAVGGEGGIPSDTLLSLTEDVSDWAEIDTDALILRAKEIRAEADGISAVLPTPAGNHRVTIRLTADFDDVKACDTHCDDGLFRPMDESFISELYRAYREAIRMGRHALFLITRTGKETSLRAMLTYAPHVSRKTAGAVKSLENAGIRVSVFLKDHSDVALSAAGECGLTEDSPAVSVAEGGASPVTLMEKGHRVFTDCRASLIEDSIRVLREKGRVVAVLSVEQEDLPLLNLANVAVTCAPSLYAAAESGHPCLPSSDTRNRITSEDGDADGLLADDLCRRRADIIIRRSVADGGGVMGVRRALLCADHIKDTLDCAFGFILLSQAARILLLLLSVLLGLALPSAPALLLSGLGIDLMATLAIAALPYPATPKKRRTMESGIMTPWRTYRNGLIAVAAGVSVSVLAASVCRFCGIEFGGDMAHYLFLCLAGLQLAVFRTSGLPRRDRAVFFATLGLALVWIAALAVALGAGLALLWTLAIPLASPLIYVTVKLILDKICVTEKKGNPTSVK